MNPEPPRFSRTGCIVITVLFIFMVSLYGAFGWWLAACSNDDAPAWFSVSTSMPGVR